MKRRLAALGLIGVAACTSPPPPATGLVWLSGCWESADESSREVWSPAYDGLQFGYSVTLADGTVSFWETLRIERMGDSLVYVASPSGRPGVEFIEAERETGRIVFENDRHDFPQRIEYRRIGNELTATISALDGTNARQFPYRRCGR